MALTTEEINKYRRLYAESTNDLVKKTAKEKLQAAGVPLTDSGESKKPTPAEPKKAESKPKAKKEDKSEPKEKPTSKMTDEEYRAYCAELMAKAKERKAKAKVAAEKRADQPKKTPATKNKEAVRGAAERVEKNVEKRVEKGDVKVAEIEKIILEYEEAIRKLKALLKKAKTTTKFKVGGSVNSDELAAILKDAHSVKDSHCKCNDKMADGGSVTDGDFGAEKAGERRSRKYSTVELKSGGSYTRRNANQYGKAKGGRTYTENRPDHSDKKRWI
jgi:hypothetical protein